MERLSAAAVVLLVLNIEDDPHMIYARDVLLGVFMSL
jgi:hypothetical protein